MVEIFGVNGFGPVNSFVATGRDASRHLNVSSARQNGLLIQALATQPTDASSDVDAVALSKDYLVAASDDAAGVKFFSRSGSVFTAQSVPSNFDCANGGCAISANGEFVAAISNLSGGAGAIWHNGSGTLTALSIGAAVGRGGSCAVSSDGTYVAFILGASPYLVVKTRSGSGSTATYSSMTIADLPSSGAASLGNQGGAVSFSPDDTYLAVVPWAAATAPRIYKFNAGTSVYENLASPFSGSLPDDNKLGCCFNQQGDMLAIAEGIGDETYLYSRSSDTFTHEATITGREQGAFSPDGNYYLCGSGQIYKKNSVSNWTLQTTITGGNGAAWSPSIP